MNKWQSNHLLKYQSTCVENDFDFACCPPKNSCSRERGAEERIASPPVMEVLGPSPSPPLASPCPSLRCGGRREQCHGEPWVYVAVGRSPEKTLGLLRWALRRFGNPRIVLLHVHQPSPLIPTLCEYCDSSVTSSIHSFVEHPNRKKNAMATH